MIDMKNGKEKSGKENLNSQKASIYLNANNRTKRFNRECRAFSAIETTQFLSLDYLYIFW